MSTSRPVNRVAGIVRVLQTQLHRQALQADHLPAQLPELPDQVVDHTMIDANRGSLAGGNRIYVCGRGGIIAGAGHQHVPNSGSLVHADRRPILGRDSTDRGSTMMRHQPGTGHPARWMP